MRQPSANKPAVFASLAQLSLIALLFCSMSDNLLAKPVTIRVDTQTAYQSMTGWEATARFWQFDKQNDRFNPQWQQHANELLYRMVNELGINRIRLEARSGMENPVDYWEPFSQQEIGYKAFRNRFYEKINDNDDPHQINPSGFHFGPMDYMIENVVLPVRQLMTENNERLYLNLTYVDFKWTKWRGDVEHARAPEEYAEFILACFMHLKEKYDLVPDALELILEADNTRNWNGKTIGHALLAVKDRLQAAGFYPQFIAPSTANAAHAPNMINALASIPGAVQALDTLSYHRYDHHVTEMMIRSIAKLADKYQLRTAMLEHIGADYRELIEDLTIGGVSSWQQYGIASTQREERGAYYFKVNNSAKRTRIQLELRARALSLLFSRVRMKATRVAASSDHDQLKPVAFLNQDGTTVLAFSTQQNQPVLIDGLAAGTYMVAHATPAGHLAPVKSIRIDKNVPTTLNAEEGFTVLAQHGAGLRMWDPNSIEPSNTDSPVHARNTGSLSTAILLALSLYGIALGNLRVSGAYVRRF